MKKIVVGLLLLVQCGFAQKDHLKWNLSKDSTLYFRSMLTLQTWVRYNQNNPGTTVGGGYYQNETFDIGIRRARLQLFGRIHKRAFIYMQLGVNNFNSVAARKPSFFIHDAVTEFIVHERILSLGAGLSGISGFARYAAPSVASTLMSDAPLFQQTTNDVNDQFLRKLSVYAKGKIKKLDYRFALTKPLPVQTALSAVDTTLKTSATFSPLPPKLQTQAYLQYQFLEEESNATAYTQGCYYGKKRVLTLGTGIIHQKDAMRFLDDSAKTQYSDLLLIGADVFFDYPFNREKRNSLTVYGGYFFQDLGKKYYRNAGVMNVGTGTAGLASLSGTGNAFPMIGTGNVIYLQSAYLFKKDLLKSLGTVQPYASLFVANYEAFDEPVKVYEAGCNWLVDENRVRISINWQSRPVFFVNASGQKTEDESQRKNMLYLQMQYFIH